MITKADISLVRSLSDRRSRVENGLFVVEGPKMVLEALRSGWKVRRVWRVESEEWSGVIGGRHSEPPNGRRGTCERSEPLFDTISPRDLERMSSLKTPQGVLAVVEIPSGEAAAPGGEPHTARYRSRGSSLAASPQHAPILALDGVQDPGNLGTIIRTADWFGIRRIVCSPNSADRFNPKAVQASMGALFRVDVSYGELVFPQGAPVFGTFMEGDNIYNVDFFESRPAGAPQGIGDSQGTGSGAVSPIIVLGNEGRGISPEVAAQVTRRVAIPSFDSSPESLNVAAAAAIFCSELFRRR